MKKHTLTLLFPLFYAAASWAQPSNDECATPIILTDVTSFCSAPAAYTNVAATASSLSAPGCFGGATATNDVWFAFTPLFTDVTITVRGATAAAPGGTLQDPQVAIYFGTCATATLPTPINCESAVGNDNIVEIYQGGLFVGSPYLIRIQGNNSATGTFQICINNYNPPVQPESDCPEAAVLCDKSPFVVQSVTGAGNLIAEINDALCFSNGIPGNYESNSTWFVWTCSQAGTLEFALTPLNSTDDLDFVVYRLPNGIGNCNGKNVMRCMASGQSQGQNSTACLGATGLRAGDPDVSEDAGCSDPGDDAWLSPLDMIAGETYALVVNNFSSTGNGFSINFGGSGEFLGPTAAFVTIPPAVCLGTPVQVIDASTSPFGSITNWQWSFGADAQPQVAINSGPHTVQFNTPGIHPVVLTVTAQTAQGRECKITEIQSVTVYPDVEVDTLIAAPDCNGGTNGAIQINNITSGTPPYLFSWNNGPFTPLDSLSGLAVGIYTLAITDANNCRTDLSIEVKEKELRVDPDVTRPLCFGDDNGIITLNVINGTSPFQFDWGGGYIPNNTQGGFIAGIYTILGLDAELCKGTYVVTVTDNPVLELVMDTMDVSCFGANDGMAIATPTGGVGNYKYLWSDGQTTQKASNLGPGQYTVTVSDGNECVIIGSVFITEPGDVGINLIDVVDLTCNGVNEGEIRVEGVGGVLPYMFSADGSSFVMTDTLTGLFAGDYWVLIKDANGCRDSVFATITQPPPLIVVATPSDTLLDLGFTVDISTITSPSGRPVTFEWIPPFGLSCADCSDPTATAVNDQLYVVKITDETGCMAFDTVLIRVNKDRPVYFPNIFGPDRPYPNDHFTGFGGPAAEIIPLLRIYDRWGSLIFETRDIPLNEPNFGWDGTYKGEKMFGVFTFYAFVRFIDQEELLYEGSVTVFR